MTADQQLTRIVQLTAELTRAGRRGEAPPTLADLARVHGVSPTQIATDIRILTLLGENVEAEWLLSLSVVQQEDRVSLTSAGPFRRPLRFSDEEWLAVQAALAADPEGAGLARRLAELRDAKRHASPPDAAGTTDRLLGVLRSAVAHRRRLHFDYAGEGAVAAERWEVEPHQVAEFRGRVYLISWCPATADWRHFRLDRVVAAVPTDSGFERRADFREVTRFEDLFRPRAVDEVVVRFSAMVARWVRERYPEARDEGDGSVTVTFPATSEAWVVRRVLEYGADAEVVGPERYREAVRRAVA